MIIKKQTSKHRLSAVQVGKITASYLRSNQAGFTIIESLVALMVVSILLAAIAPVIALSAATRVQSRRVELATQAARAYIDGVRTKQINAPATIGTGTDISAFNAPTPSGSFNCSTNSYCTNTSTSTTPTNLYCIDFDGTGSCENTSITDMVLQVFRYNSASTNAISGYALGLRVYRADAFRLSTTLSRNNATGNNEKLTQNSFTGGAGQRTSPLLEMTTEISDTVPKYGDLCTRLSGCNN